MCLTFQKSERGEVSRGNRAAVPDLKARFFNWIQKGESRMQGFGGWAATVHGSAGPPRSEWRAIKINKLGDFVLAKSRGCIPASIASIKLIDNKSLKCEAV